MINEMLRDFQNVFNNLLFKKLAISQVFFIIIFRDYIA